MQCCECFAGPDLSPFLVRNMDASMAHEPGMAELPIWAKAFSSLAVVAPRIGQKNRTPEVILSPHSFTNCLDN